MCPPSAAVRYGLDRRRDMTSCGSAILPKAYEIDGEVLRTGSANFSTSGENAQDNDLIVIRDPGAAAKFDAHAAHRAVGSSGDYFFECS